jgi:hypothetical protein
MRTPSRKRRPDYWPQPHPIESLFPGPVHGIRRTMGSAPVRKTPATADKVVAMAALADTSTAGICGL